MAKTVKLLLTDTVDNLGIVGDVVTVRTGYARNYLLPRGLAQTPSDEAIAALAERRREVQAELARIRGELEGMMAKMEGHEITLERSCNDSGWLYGSVTQGDIAEALVNDGFSMVTDRHIRIGTTIKRIDSYDIPVQVATDLKTEIKLWVVADRPLGVDDDEDKIEFDDDGNIIDKPRKEARDESENAEEAAPAADA